MSGQSFPPVMTRFLHHATDSQPAANAPLVSEVPSAGDNRENSIDSGRLLHNFGMLLYRL